METFVLWFAGFWVAMFALTMVFFVGLCIATIRAIIHDRN